MIKEYKRTFLFLCVGLILFVLGCGTFPSSTETKNPTEKLPIRTLFILIEENQRKELFAQLEMFSEKYQLSFNLDFVKGSKGEEIFFVVMSGEGLTISALSSPFPYTEELHIGFYEEDPSNPPPQELVDEMYNELRVFISEIEGVVILEE